MRPRDRGNGQNKRSLLTLDSLCGGNMNISAYNLGGNLWRVFGYEIKFALTIKKCD